MANFYRALAQYREEIAAKAAPLEGMHPITAQKVDLSLGMFVDDLLRFILLDDVSKAVEESNEDTRKLDHSIVPWRYAQNRTKAEITANLRSNARAREFFESKALVGKPLGEFIQLGAVFNPQGSNISERLARLAVVGRGWRELGSFWVSGANWKSKRLLFISVVYSAALCGLTSFAVTARDLRPLDASINKKLRAAMLGAACFDAAG